MEITRLDKIVPDAYHGTELNVAEKILKEQRFEVGSGEKLFLGEGAYFYEGSANLAEVWALKQGRKRGWKTYGVLQARIQLGRCLDLNCPEHRRELEQWAEELMERLDGIKNPDDITPAG